MLLPAQQAGHCFSQWPLVLDEQQKAAGLTNQPSCLALPAKSASSSSTKQFASARLWLQLSVMLYLKGLHAWAGKTQGMRALWHQHRFITQMSKGTWQFENMCDLIMLNGTSAVEQDQFAFLTLSEAKSGQNYAFLYLVRCNKNNQSS